MPLCKYRLEKECWVVKKKKNLQRDHNPGENKQGSLSIHISHITGWVPEDWGFLRSSVVKNMPEMQEM